MQPQGDVGADPGPKSPTTSLLEGFVGNDSYAVIQENVYTIVGHGRLQTSVLLCTILSFTVLLMHAFAYSLVGLQVDHWCKPPSELRELSVHVWKNVAIPVLADGSLSKCTVYDPPVPDDSQEERHEVPCHRWDYDIMNIRDSIVSMWDLVCESSWLYFTSSYIYTVGSLCVVPVVGIMADRVGRRPVTLASAALMLFASMAAGSAQVFGLFVLARFVISAAASATNVLNFIVLYEVTGDQHRALYIFVANIIATSLAPVLYNLLWLLRPGWGLSHTILVAASALVLAWCYSIDESPVWQIATCRIRQAEITILHAARSNGVDILKARATLKVLKRQLMKREASSGTGTDGWERLLFTAFFRRRALSIFVSWFCVSFAFYGARLDHLTLEKHWQPPAHLFKILLLTAVYYNIKTRGQGATLTTVLILQFVFSAFLTLCYEWKHALGMPLSTLMVFGVTTAALCVNYSYTGEVFPTAIRSVGFCASYSFGNAGALLATLIEAYAGDQRVLALNCSMTVLSLVGGVAVQWLPEIFLPETKSADPGKLDEQQRKDALKMCLDPLGSTAKVGKRSAALGPRKSKRALASTGASVASSAASSVNLSTEPVASVQRSIRSSAKVIGSPLTGTASPSKAGSAGALQQKAKLPSEIIRTPQNSHASQLKDILSPLSKAVSPSEETMCPPKRGLHWQSTESPLGAQKQRSKKAQKHRDVVQNQRLN